MDVVSDLAMEEGRQLAALVEDDVARALALQNYAYLDRLHLVVAMPFTGAWRPYVASSITTDCVGG